MTKSNGTSLTTTKSGKVKRATREKSINIRMSEEEIEIFQANVMLDAAIHGGDPNYAATIRTLIRQYNERVQATAASQEATDGAKVLRKKVRS